jgi:uncharacterized lipoprotein YajG
MVKLAKQLRLSVALLAVLFMSGCMSLNSQVIDLHPNIEVSRSLGHNKRILVVPKDLRTTPVIGFRAIKESPQPEIVLKDSLHLLKHTTEHALEDMGIHRLYSGEFTMEVSLIDLSYTVKKNALKQTVILDMKLRIKVSKGEKSYTGTYSSDRQHIFVGTPSEKENEEVINELVSSTMNLAFNDKQLLDFIQFN